MLSQDMICTRKRDNRTLMMKTDENKPEENDEGLELDKLEVPNDQPRSKGGETATDNKTSSKPVTEKVTLGPREKVKSKRPLVIGGLLVGLTVALFFVFQSVIKETSNRSNKAETLQSVVYLVSTVVEEDYYVEFKLHIPFSNGTEKASLLNMLPRLKEEFSRASKREKFMASIKAKDVAALQTHLLKLINELSNFPVMTLRIEDLIVRKKTALPIS